MAEASKADLMARPAGPRDDLEKRSPRVFIPLTKDQVRGLESGVEVEVTLKGTVETLHLSNSDEGNTMTITVERSEVYPESGDRAEIRRQTAMMMED